MVKLPTRSSAFAAWVALAMFLLSCDYESHETFVKKIPTPDLSSLSIDLSSHSNDTLYLFETTHLTYDAFLHGREPYGAYVYMDGIHIQTLQNNDTDFTIDARQYETGRHVLRLELYASAGTGSLADIAGAEQLKLTREWIAYIDNSAPSSVDFTSVGIVDGSMTINWTRYPKMNFSAYVLEKQYWSESYEQYMACWKQEFTKKGATSFRDSTYLGGKIRYRVRIRAGEMLSPYAIAQFEHVYDPAPAFEWIDREQVRVTWNQPRIANSFKAYETSLAFTNRATITSITDTSLVLKPGIAFGQRASFSLTVHTNGNRCEGGSPVHKNIVLGNAFVPFIGDRIFYCKEIDQYFTQQYTDENYNLIRIDGKTNAVAASIPFEGKFSVSANGSYLYITYDNVLKQLDPLTLAVVKIHNLYELAGTYASIPGRVQVSDNHHVSFSTYDSTYVVTMPDFKVVYRAASDYGMGMSPSGNTIVSNRKLWTWNGTGFTEQYSFADDFRGLFKDDQTLIKIYYDDKIAVQNLSTFQENAVALASNPDVIVYDPVSDLIGYAQESATYEKTTSFHLIDMQAKVVKTFDVAQLDNHRGQHIFLTNDQILCSLGSSIPLSYYYP